MPNNDIDRILHEASGDEEHSHCPLRDEYITRSLLLRVLSEKSNNIARTLTSLAAVYQSVTEAEVRNQLDACVKALVAEAKTVAHQFDYVSAMVECDIADNGRPNEKE